jgi:thiamine biosynthesis protein ThiI
MDAQNQNTFIVRCGEVALKGQNKPFFERLLVARLRKSLSSKFEAIEIRRNEGLVFIKAPKDYDPDSVAMEISRVFGVASVSHAVETESALEAIALAAVAFMTDLIDKKPLRSFKVEAKRANKDFPMESPDIARLIGGRILAACRDIRVDVHKPECRLFVDVRRDRTYIYVDKTSGFGGLPLGTNGKGLILLSGGIDSPVAAWMMAKRGMLIEAVHFHAYPYTSERARQKVMDLADILSEYCGKIRIHTINLLEIQQQVAEKCPADEMTIITRRFMMKIGEIIAKETNCDMLITGENLGQVASQTAKGLVVTNQAVTIPVMRPLIAFDKVDIMDIARRIGTFETSIQPYEDCCTVFLPKHPVTKPEIGQILKSEAAIDEIALIGRALKSREIVTSQILA